jgi:uncharacterized protein YbjT (DUF2867 family)
MREGYRPPAAGPARATTGRERVDVWHPPDHRRRTMRVVIAGGHGQIALLLERVLAERGDAPVGIVRNPDHVEDVERTGAEAVVLDLEKADVASLTDVVRGADAVVFAAGGGPHSGAARKETVDRGAAVLLAAALHTDSTIRTTFDLLAGHQTVDAALAGF